MKISWRIKGTQWIPDVEFGRTLDLLREQRAVVDEIALVFDDPYGLTHGWQPEAAIRAQGTVLARRISDLKAAGFASVGVNLWPSTGERGVLEFSCGWLPKLPFQNLVGPDGSVDEKGGCITDPACLAHLRLRGDCMAAARPDFVWIDEYRGNVCYCQRCLAAFDGGRWRERVALLAALETPENGALRRAWVDFCGRAKAEAFTRTLREALDVVDPGICLGLMIVGTDISQNVGDFAPAMLKAGRISRLRPGHGWYADYDMRGILRKSAETGRLIQRLGGGIDDIQHEWEHWPGGTLDKSQHATVVEITAALMAGNTGVAMNDGPFIDGVDELMRDDMRTLATWRPAWRRLTGFLKGTEPVGLHLIAPPDAWARTSVTDGWQAQGRRITEAFAYADAWQLFGFPLSPRQQDATGILLAGPIAKALSDSELTTILSGFAILDGEAAEVLALRGLSSLTGVSAGPWRSDTAERLTDHPFNGAYAGRQRWRAYGDGRVLQPTEAGVVVLGRLLRMDGVADLGASTTCFTNRLGGRVAVLGYEAWQLVGSPHRWLQLQNLIAWGSGDDVPLRFDRLRRVAPFVRRSADRQRCAVLLLNMGVDPTGTMTVTLPAGSSHFVLLNADGSESPLEAQPNGKTIRVQVPDLPAWGMAIVLGNAH